MEAKLEAVAPKGALRVAIALSPAPGPFWSGRNSAGEPCGVAVDLGRAMAERLGVPFEPLIYTNSGAITDAAAGGGWDIAFVPMDAERARKLDFGPVYHVGELTFLVRPGFAATTLADVDRPGVRVLGIMDTTTIRAIGAWLRQTSVEGLSTVEEVMARLAGASADAFGMSRDALDELARNMSGSRVLPGHFFQAKTAVAAPQGRPDTLTFAARFINEAKASGLMRRIFDSNGLGGQAVAASE